MVGNSLNRFINLKSSIFLAAFSVFFLGTVHATLFPKMSFDEKFESSDIVVKAQVLSQNVAWHEGHIVTFSHLRVLKTYKGQIFEHEKQFVVAAYPGGRLGEYSQKVFGTPSLKLNENYIFLLGEAIGPNWARGITTLAGGVFPIEEGTFGHDVPMSLQGLEQNLDTHLGGE